MINLDFFCGDGRPYLAKPWSDGEYTYATNGHICVRVPKQDDAELDEANRLFSVKINEYLANIPGCNMLPMPKGTLPQRVKDCVVCRGSGQVTCPCCDRPGAECDNCGGMGGYRAPTVEVLPGIIVNAEYFALIHNLPNARIGCHGKGTPVFFEFDDGCGALMPLMTDTIDASIAPKEATS